MTITQENQQYYRTMDDFVFVDNTYIIFMGSNKETLMHMLERDLWVGISV